MPKYPLEPLSRVRLKKVDDATRTFIGSQMRALHSWTLRCRALETISTAAA